MTETIRYLDNNPPLKKGERVPWVLYSRIGGEIKVRCKNALDGERLREMLEKRNNS